MIASSRDLTLFPIFTSCLFETRGIPVPEPHKVAAAYLRCSNDDPKQVSIGRQRDFCLAAAALHGYEIPELLVFVDEGISGALLERSGPTAMLNAARSGEVAAVFTYDEDRLARNHGYARLIGEELKSLRIQLFIQDRPSDDTPEGVIQRGFMSLFAEYERLGQHAGGAHPLSGPEKSERLPFACKGMPTRGRGERRPFGEQALPGGTPDTIGFPHNRRLIHGQQSPIAHEPAAVDHH
jgi:hypothetical protein